MEYKLPFEDIKLAMGPYCRQDSTKVLVASFFPDCPIA